VDNYHDYRDFEQLSLSESDTTVLNNLYAHSVADDVEYGAVIIANNCVREFTDGLRDRVSIPNDIPSGQSLRLFHSHTIDTPLSPSDMAFLSFPDIDEVCVTTRSRSVFRVLVNGGIKPDYNEYTEKTYAMDDEANFALMRRPDFWDWEYDIRNYMATREQMFLTARLFKWRLEGGRI